MLVPSGGARMGRRECESRTRVVWRTPGAHVGGGVCERHRMWSVGSRVTRGSEVDRGELVSKPQGVGRTARGFVEL